MELTEEQMARCRADNVRRSAEDAERETLRLYIKNSIGTPHEIVLVTTAPNPRSSDRGYDAGQRGWVLHAIRARSGETENEIRFRKSLCGVLPSHGWGLDMFIDRECLRCSRVVAQRF